MQTDTKMEENNKYYTPTIDEFHVGFECEYNKEKFEIENEDQLHLLCVELIASDNIRVKYLDQADIESLGWQPSKRHDNIRFTLPINEEDDFPQWRLEIFTHPTAPNEIDIFQLAHEGGRRRELFAATIRNKSELRKLMQQLNIK